MMSSLFICCHENKMYKEKKEMNENDGVFIFNSLVTLAPD